MCKEEINLRSFLKEQHQFFILEILMKHHKIASKIIFTEIQITKVEECNIQDHSLRMIWDENLG